MPTGHTANLYDGKPQTFTDFAMACARSFGALASLRDHAPDAVIPERFEPDPWAGSRLANAKRTLAALEARTPDEWFADLQESNERLAATNRDAQQEAHQRRRRYQEMLDQVDAWVPPSSEHQQLQTFMRAQLEDSIRYDCTAADGLGVTSRVRLSVEGYRDEQLGAARAELTRATATWGDAIARANQRTWWVQQLRASLPTETETTP